jgi:hypothetical protein
MRLGRRMPEEAKCSVSEIMHRLQGMSYNLPTSKHTVPYRLRGCATCLGPHRRSAPFSPRTFYGKPASWSDARRLRISPSSGTSLPCCFTENRTCPMRRPANAWAFRGVRSDVGASGGPLGTFLWRTPQDGGASPFFPPLDQALVKAVTCERVAETKQPLSRQSLADITARVRRALGKPSSRSTVWRILETDAIKPWRYKYWIFPRDPRFAEKAGPILDLYAGRWQGKPLGPKDHILSADEKTSIQARIRCHPSLPPAPGRPAYIENEYERGGALQYLAAWDVRRGYVIGRCEPKTGIAPFGRLVN